jgi:hypothetical protein
MEDKEYECPTCRGAGDWRDEEHKKHDCPDCDGEGKYVDVDDMEEDNEKNYRQPGFNNPRKYTDDLGIMGKKDKMKEGKMKGLALDMEELSDEEFEKKYKSKKSDWKEVKNKELRMDPDQPAYIKKMKSVAGDLAAEDTVSEGPTRKDFQMVADLLKSVDDPQKKKDLAHHHADMFSKQNPRFDRERFLRAAGIMEDDVEEGNEFTQALAQAKAQNKKEFEVDGKVYQVKESELDRIKHLAGM